MARYILRKKNDVYRIWDRLQGKWSKQHADQINKLNSKKHKRTGSSTEERSAEG